jgi:hypothetical protein
MPELSLRAGDNKKNVITLLLIAGIMKHCAFFTVRPGFV